MLGAIVRFFTSRPAPPPIAIPKFEPALPADDDVSEIATEAESTEVQDEPNVGDDVDGLTFGIEYRDASGNATRRRITCHKFKNLGGGYFYLMAFCHERSAFRQFRSDRIESVIDHDGVIWNPFDFFIKIGVNFSSSSVYPPDPEKKPKPGVKQRAVCRDELRLLAALSRSDGRMHDSEVEIMLDFAADACDLSSVSFSEEDREALERYLRRLRPDASSINKSIDNLAKSDGRAVKRLSRAMIAVMDADKEQAPEEMAFVMEMQAELHA